MWESLKQDYGYSVCCEGCKLPFFIWLIVNIWKELWHEIKASYCRFKGHDWVDDSYGGPESGCMAGHCERCGCSFHTILY